jgi:hypothetical protein
MNIFTFINHITRDFRLPPLCNLDPHSSGLLRSVDWLVVIDVSGQPIVSISKGEDCLLVLTEYSAMLSDCSFCFHFMAQQGCATLNVRHL